MVKIIYDISLIGHYLFDPRWQTGLFRYASEIYAGLQNEDLQIFYAHTAYPRSMKTTINYLNKQRKEHLLCNERAYNLPRNIFGRAERFFDAFYRLADIEIDKILFSDNMFREAHVYHTPFNKIPAEIIKYTALKKIITIHDIIPIRYPNHSQKAHMEEVIRSAERNYIICVSEFTRNDLLNHSPWLQPDHVFVSHLAADPQKFYLCEDPSKFKMVKDRYGLPDQYFLSLCTLEPRKNLVHLIRCFLQFVKQENVNDIYLVLAGAEGWEYDHIYDEIDHADSFKHQIVMTGRIAENDLASIYSHANSFYFMSLYEGFGLPPLEAMQCGTPVVTSNTTSLPEVVGDAGIMLSPDDEDGLCQVMSRFYDNNELRNYYRHKSLKQAKKFSWEKCVQEHIGIYHSVMQSE